MHLFCFISIMKLYSFETKWITKQTKSLGIFHSCLTTTKLYYRLLIRNGSTNFLHPRASTLNPNGKKEKEKITGKSDLLENCVVSRIRWRFIHTHVRNREKEIRMYILMIIININHQKKRSNEEEEKVQNAFKMANYPYKYF